MVASQELLRLVTLFKISSEYLFVCNMLWITVTVLMAGIGIAICGVVDHPDFDLPDDELGSSSSTTRRGKCECESIALTWL